MRFIFGGRCCPFCVQFAWQHHARLHKETYPLAANAVLEYCYMDDLMSSAPQADKAKETRKKLGKIGDLAGFHNHKWISSELDVIADVAEGDRVLRQTQRRENYQQPRIWVSCDVPQMANFPLDTHYGQVYLNSPVVYAHHVYEGGNITARLIRSKSRLATVKAVSPDQSFWVHPSDYD